MGKMFHQSVYMQSTIKTDHTLKKKSNIKNKWKKRLFTLCKEYNNRVVKYIISP